MKPFIAPALLLLAALSGPGAAQDAPPDVPPPPNTAEPLAPDPGPMPDMRELVVDSLARIALTTLRDEMDPSADSFARTATALSIARRLRPDDLELIRLERESWKAAGEDDRANELLERIVALDPTDTVSVARLLMLRIGALQTADERLAAYDRLLGESGSAIDPSIRSRIALDAALLLRERGEESAFVERLTLATTLDVTNKDAAALYASYFLPRTSDAQVGADLLANVVLSDPTDLSTLANLAQHLFSRGAYRGTQRLFGLAGSLANGSGRPLGTEDVFDRLLVDWMVDGDSAAEKPIQDMLDQQQSYINMQIRQAEKFNQPLPEQTEAELPVSFETIRLAVAFGRRDDEGVRAAAERATATMSRQLDQLRQRSGPFEDFTEEQAENAARSTELELAFLRLWGNIQIDEAEATIDEVASLEDQGGLTPEAIQRFRGLIALRRDDPERARALLAPLAETDYSARVGMALLNEQAGNQREAIADFAHVALERPNTALGCACRRRIEIILGRTLQPTPESQALDRFGLDFAPWLDHFTESPHNFMSLVARQATTRLDLFDRVEVRLRLRNVSSYPLGVGPERPINSRFAITPNVVIEGRPRSPLNLPEIVNLDRRFRLMPREEMELTVWATRGPVGIVLEQNSDRSISLRWRVIQGIRYDDDDRFASGPMCVSAETDVAFRTNLKEPASIDELIASLATSTGRRYLDDVLLAAGTAVRRLGGVTDAQQVQRRIALGEAIAARIPELDEFTQAYSACVGFRAGFLFSTPKLLEVLSESPSVYVKAALLLTSFRLAENDGADRLRDDPDPDIARLAVFAARHRERMRAVVSQPVLPEPDDKAPEEEEAPPEEAQPE